LKIVYLVLPLPSHWNPIVLVTFITTLFRNSNNRQDHQYPKRELLSIRAWPDARNSYRKRLEGKRDGLRLSNGSSTEKNINLFSGGVLFLLVVLHFLVLAKLHHRPYINIDRLRLWESSAGVVILTAYWIFMKRLNEHAAKAIQ
jgi:hypothetical protein